MRGLFDIALRNGWPSLSSKLLTMSKMVERRMWSFEHPLKQFGRLKREVLEKLENTRTTLDRMKDMTADELGTGGGGGGGGGKWEGGGGKWEGGRGF